MNVNFAPTLAQTYGGNVSVASNSTGGSAVLPISGSGFVFLSTPMVTVLNGVLQGDESMPQTSYFAGKIVELPFEIGKYEVTWAEWRQVCDWAVDEGYDIANVGNGTADNHPVTNVNWYDVVKWCNARSQMEGLTPVYQVGGATYKTGYASNPAVNSEANGYRLPTELEWEWAARGGVSSKGYDWSGSNDPSQVAWTYDDGIDRTSAVGTKLPNELGIFDMSGNVDEWVFDLSDVSGGPILYGFRMIRGGGFTLGDGNNKLGVERSNGIYPYWRYGASGFRVARRSSATPVPPPTPAPSPSPVTPSLILVNGGVLPQALDFGGTSVASFQIGKYEVTWDEWLEVREWGVNNGYVDLENIGDARSECYPVTDVSWYDVVKWCNAKSEKEGLAPVYLLNDNIYRTGPTLRDGVFDVKVSSTANGYRLPTEPEWLWAASGGLESQGYTYSGSNDINEVARYYGNSAVIGIGREIWPGGTKSPNELGIFDMSGNVSEWCYDSNTTGSRAFRGGKWSSDAIWCTLALPNNYQKAGTGTSSSSRIGFRLARSSAQ